MHDRSLKLDLFALLLFALIAFTGVSMISYQKADPVPSLPGPLASIYRSDVLVYPMHESPHNLCGKWGAFAADFLYSTLGVGAYLGLMLLAALDSVLLRRQKLSMPILRLLGGMCAVTGLATLAALTLPGFSPGPVVGPGGYVGLLGRNMLEMHFAMTGGVIIALAFLVGGLLVASDYAVVIAALWCVAGIRQGMTRSPRTDMAAKPAKGEARAAADDGASVRIQGKRLDDLSPVSKRGKKAVPLVEEDHVETDDDDDAPITIPIKDRIAGKASPAVLTAASLEKPTGKGAKVPPVKVEVDEEEATILATDNAATSVAAALAPAAATESRLKIKRGNKPNERDEVIEQLEAASRVENAIEYQLPGLDLLLPSEDVNFEQQAIEVRRKAKILEKTFADFGFQVRVVEIETGPVIAQYEVELEAGLRLSKITGLAEDLAIALRVPSVRIVAPIPGKNTVGIEVPNEERQIVRLREVMEEANGKVKKMRIPLFLGKDVSGNPLVVDLSTLPHLLIAGRTGTGKSVCLNAIICSLLMTRRPDEVRMLMIDPKMVELSGYGTLPHLMHPVVTDMRKAEAILAWGVEKMEERYALLARAGVRHISAYNQLGEEELMDRLQPETDEDRQHIPLHLPYIVIVADELADLMMTAGKEVEQHIIRLAQKSRAVGIHLILATQKPTVDVITGLIKSNLPARIAFQVASRTDSRVVLDEMGADKLLGNGDMLFLWPGTSTLLRGQGTYVSDEEINGVVDCVSTGEQDFVKELVQLKPKSAEGEEATPATLKKRDELYEESIEVVIREGRGSVSLLQRALGIGYGRAARLIDFMAEDGIVGSYAGSHAREVLISLDDWAAMKGEASEAEVAAPPKAKRSNKITPFVEPVESDSDEEDYDDEGDASSYVGENDNLDDEPFDDPDSDNESVRHTIRRTI